MTASDQWKLFFPLFLENGLLPVPGVVKRLWEKNEAEFAKVQDTSSHDDKNVKVWEVKKRQASQRLRDQNERALRDIANYPEFSPTAEDWMALAICLAIKHDEEGFGLLEPGEKGRTGKPSVPRLQRKSIRDNWHRDNLVEHFTETKGTFDEHADRLRKGNRPFADDYHSSELRKKAAIPHTAAEASQLAKEHIEGLQPKKAGTEYGKTISAPSLKTAFSTRNAARKAARSAVSTARIAAQNAQIAELRILREIDQQEVEERRIAISSAPQKTGFKAQNAARIARYTRFDRTKPQSRQLELAEQKLAELYNRETPYYITDHLRSIEHFKSLLAQARDLRSKRRLKRRVHRLNRRARLTARMGVRSNGPLS